MSYVSVHVMSGSVTPCVVDHPLYLCIGFSCFVVTITEIFIYLFHGSSLRSPLLFIMKDTGRLLICGLYGLTRDSYLISTYSTLGREFFSNDRSRYTFLHKGCVTLLTTVLTIPIKNLVYPPVLRVRSSSSPFLKVPYTVLSTLLVTHLT